MFGFNLGFDQNKYLIEQKKQTIETKAKKALQESEEEKKKKQIQKDEIKKVIETATNNINKIQINFHNSFINKETHKTYDIFIEKNNKIEIDNLVNSKIVNETASNNITDGIPNNQGTEIILMESYSQNKENNKTILEENTILYESINNSNYLSKTIKIESEDEDYEKEDFTYYDIDENKELEVK